LQATKRGAFRTVTYRPSVAIIVRPCLVIRCDSNPLAFLLLRGRRLLLFVIVLSYGTLPTALLGNGLFLFLLVGRLLLLFIGRCLALLG
jgi:hypothetical protein